LGDLSLASDSFGVRRVDLTVALPDLGRFS